MKKRLLSALFCLSVICSLLPCDASATTCENHVYDQCIQEEQYLKSEETATAPAMYYKSCVCGDSAINASTWTSYPLVDSAGDTLAPYTRHEDGLYRTGGKWATGYGLGYRGFSWTPDISTQIKFYVNYSGTSLVSMVVENPDGTVKQTYRSDKGTLPTAESGAITLEQGDVVYFSINGDAAVKQVTPVVCENTYIFEAHYHTFDQCVEELRYLKTAATCTEPAVYYKSCECGAISESTWTSYPLVDSAGGTLAPYTRHEDGLYRTGGKWATGYGLGYRGFSWTPDISTQIKFYVNYSGTSLVSMVVENPDGTVKQTYRSDRGTLPTAESGAITLEQGDVVYFSINGDAAVKQVTPVVCENTYIFTASGSNGHTMEHHSAVDVGCTTDGNSEYWYCSACDNYFSDEDGTVQIAENSWVINATGHVYDQCIAEAQYLKSAATVDSPAVYYKSCVCGKKCDFVWSDAALSTEKSCMIQKSSSFSHYQIDEGFKIYIPTASGYICQDFGRTINQNANCDIWRLDETNLLDEELNKVIPLTVKGSEWEMAVHIQGAKDFIGGYAHGDEVTDIITFYLDGVEIDPDDVAELTDFNEFKAVVTSTGYNPDNQTEAALTHVKEYVFDKNGIHLTQSVTWLNSYSMGSVSYLGMYPVKKTVTFDGLEIDLSNAYYSDVNSVPTRLDNTINNNKTISGAKSIWMYSTESSFKSRMWVENNSASTGGDFLVSDSGGNTYNKIYAVYMRNENVSAGDVWNQVTHWSFDYDTTESTFASGDPLPFLLGDVNQDGVVTAEDLTVLARHVAKIEELTNDNAILSADVTGDDDVTSADLTKLACYVAGIINTL